MFTHFPLLSFSQVDSFMIVIIYKKRLLIIYFISLKFSLEPTLLKVKLIIYFEFSAAYGMFMRVTCISERCF